MSVPLPPEVESSAQLVRPRRRQPDSFSLPPLSAASVDAPLIDECNANFECRRADTQLVNRYKSFVLEVIEALIDRARRN